MNQKSFAMVKLPSFSSSTVILPSLQFFYFFSIFEIVTLSISIKNVVIKPFIVEIAMIKYL